MPALIIGIDLGATTTVVSRINVVGEPQLVMNWDNAPFTDSAIWFPEDSPAQPIFGSTALGMVGVVEEGVFHEYKRDMGTERVYHAHGKQYTPTELSAFMLRKQREHIENTYDQKIDSVVISVPANFLNEARAATITAAKAAGFPDPITTIDESTAAALFYAYKAPIALNGKYLMVHFDANTLDVTAFEAKDTQIEVKHSMGVSQLGDKSFNAATYDLVSQKFKEKTGSNIEGHAACFSDFDVEKVKHRLTEVEKHEFKIYSALHGKVAVTVTRAEFEEQISALITQLQYCIEAVLGKTGISSSDLKGVFMTGVSSQIPAVQACVRRISGIKPTQEIDNRAVAHGAALFAAHRLGIRKPQTLWPEIKPATSRMRLIDVYPHYIGILERDWLTGKVRNRPIIMKGAHLPQSHEFLLSADSGGAFPEIIISQCAFETTDRDDVTVLAEFHGHSTNGKPYAKGLLILEVDGNAVFKGKFKEIGTGKTTLFTMKHETDAPPPPDIDDFIV